MHLEKWGKKVIRVAISRKSPNNPINIAFFINFMQKENSEFLQGWLAFFGVILNYKTNKTQQRINNIILSHNFAPFIEFLEKNQFCPKKGVSGVPYLKIGTWEVYVMHIKFKHLGPLVMWNCQNSWKWKWPLFQTVNGMSPGKAPLTHKIEAKDWCFDWCKDY